MTTLAYSPADFAKLYGISRATVYVLISNGTLIARKIGRATRLFLEDNPGFPGNCPIATAMRGIKSGENVAVHLPAGADKSVG